MVQAGHGQVGAAGDGRHWMMYEERKGVRADPMEAVSGREMRSSSPGPTPQTSSGISNGTDGRRFGCRGGGEALEEGG
jgi:hypothetical protein